MESEKVKEIKKALEYCKYRMCDVCPRLRQEPSQEEDCRLDIIDKSLTLINELESENERLRKERDKYIVENKDIEESNTYANKFLEKNKEENQQLKDRIAELEKENKIVKEMLSKYGVCVVTDADSITGVDNE